MELFDKIDRVQYQGVTLTNILRRVKPIKRILDQIDVYYEYTIKEGERADTIAFDYYGSSTYTWLIYITNNIYDPYYQWPMDDQQLIKYIERKYGDYYQSQVDLKGYTHPDYDYIVTEITFNAWSQEKQFGWRPITIFEWEAAENEKRRYIKLISNQYTDEIDKQVEKLFRNGRG